MNTSDRYDKWCKDSFSDMWKYKDEVTNEILYVYFVHVYDDVGYTWPDHGASINPLSEI